MIRIMHFGTWRSVGLLRVLAIVGNQELSATIQWDVYQGTNDPFAIGLVGLINANPVILLALPAGRVADWFRRTRTHTKLIDTSRIHQILPVS